MKLGKLSIVFLAFGLFFSIGVFAQKNIHELKKLDSLAFTFYEKNETKKAEETAYQIIEKYNKTKQPSLFLINAYTLLGIINKNRGYYITSLENNIHALNIAEKNNDTGRVSACLNNIGVIYQLQSNYKQAIKYFTRSLEIEEKKNNPLQKSIRYYNIGDCYKELDSFDIALSYFNNSLIIEEKYKNNEGIIFAYLGIAEVYLGLKNQFQAKMVLDKIDGRIKSEQIEEKIIYNKLLGHYNILIKKSSEALKYLNLAESLSNKNKISSHLLEVYLFKIEAFEQQNDILSANKEYKKYIKFNNELTNSEIKNKIEDLTYQNELTKKELEIKLVKEDRKLEKDLRIYGQKITWFVISVLVISVILILYGIKKLTDKKG